MIISVLPCKADYTLWNSSTDREIQTINEWYWMIKERYANHFYNYCLECLKKLDYCNRNRKNSQYSDVFNKFVISYTDSVNRHIVGTYSNFLSGEELPIFLEPDAQGSNVIFAGDIRISHNNIQLMIDKNNEALGFINNIQSIDNIKFDFSFDKTKEKYLDIKIPFQKGGCNYLRWGNEEFLNYSYMYHIPTKSHIISSIYLGSFTVEQLKHLNKVLQYILDI